MIAVDTLRVSVTDRCNLRCAYCMPPEGVKSIPHREILTFEEIERVVRAAAGKGVSKVRITGGEPLVRKDVTGLAARLAAIPGVKDLPMTTNGVLLEEMAPGLKKAGLTRITVSLDTLRPDRYEQITRRPWLDRASKGINAAIAADLRPIKINAVAIPGLNDDEVLDFVELSEKLKVEVRFIERMPIINRELGPDCGIASGVHIPSARLREMIEEKKGKLIPITSAQDGSPATVYGLEKGAARVGFVSAMSEPFCKWCKRMRLTPDGKLRPCLISDREVDVKTPLRAGATDQELKEIFQNAVDMKPSQKAACFAPTNRIMSQIGG